MADNTPFYGGHDPETLVVLDFDDRRRLTAEEVLLLIERQQGEVYPMQFGQVLLNNVTHEDEIIPMSEQADASVMARLMQRRRHEQ